MLTQLCQCVKKFGFANSFPSCKAPKTIVQHSHLHTHTHTPCPALVCAAKLCRSTSTGFHCRTHINDRLTQRNPLWLFSIDQVIWLSDKLTDLWRTRAVIELLFWSVCVYVCVCASICVHRHTLYARGLLLEDYQRTLAT